VDNLAVGQNPCAIFNFLKSFQQPLMEKGENVYILYLKNQLLLGTKLIIYSISRIILKGKFSITTLQPEFLSK